MSNEESGLTICDIAKKTFLDSKAVFNILEDGKHALDFQKTENGTQTLYSLAE